MVIVEMKWNSHLCADLSIAVEGAACDGLLHGLRGLELRPRVLVPEGKAAIGAHRRQGSMHRMKCNVVDGIYILETVGDSIRPVAFEREVVLWVLRIGILDGYSPFDRAQSESCGLRGRLLVPKDGDAPVLILQRRVNPFELFRLTVEVVDNEATIGRTNYSHGKVNVGYITALTQVDRHDGVRRPGIPKLERLVP